MHSSLFREDAPLTIGTRSTWRDVWGDFETTQLCLSSGVRRSVPNGSVRTSFRGGNAGNERLQELAGWSATHA